MEYLNHYVEKTPDVKALRADYQETINNLDSYFSQCEESLDARRTEWTGKSRDLRKHGPNAFPWDDASDIEVPLIAEKINTYVSMCVSALKKSNIRAYPVESGDASRSKLVSAFLKWMVTTYIERFTEEMEENANYLFEKGMMITYVGWEKEDRTYLQVLNIEQIAAAAPKLAQAVMDGQDDDALIALLQEQYPNLKRAKAKRALKDLRKTGEAELPVSLRKVNRPVVRAAPADGEVFFPAYTLDPQSAPVVYYRVYMTPQEILQKVETEGWDPDWAEYVIENYRGDTSRIRQTGSRSGSTSNFRRTYTGESDYVEILHIYQRLTDPDDGSEGIYRTIMHSEYVGDSDSPGYGKFELLNGLEDYPFIVTKLSEESREMYDVQTFSDYLRGIQWQVKVERDQRIDKSSISTLPPIMHPAQRPPQEWGPGRKIPYVRPGELHFGPVPTYTPDSSQIEQVLIDQGNALIGLDFENPAAPIRQQFYIDKFLSHVRDVLRATYKNYTLYGPDELFFRITGMTEGQQMQKGGPDEEFDIMVSFDTQNNDPDSVEKRLAQMVQLLQLDRNGKIDVDRLIEIAAGVIDPVIADAVIRPSEESRQQMTQQVTEDLTKISSAIEVPARPQGAGIAMSMIQQYAAQPDVTERLQNDEAFAERLKKYYDQYQHQADQQMNAQVGVIGTTPSSMGGVPTQDMNT